MTNLVQDMGGARPGNGLRDYDDHNRCEDFIVAWAGRTSSGVAASPTQTTNVGRGLSRASFPFAVDLITRALPE